MHIAPFWIILTAVFFWISLPSSVVLPVFNKKLIIPKKLTIPFLNKTINFDKSLKLGLDLQGGTHFVFLVKIEGSKKEDLLSAVEASREIVERRVNFFGISEPVVSLLKSGKTYKIAVDIPGKNNAQEAIKFITKTTSLDFRSYVIEEVKLPQSTQSAQQLIPVKTPLNGSYLKRATLVFDQKNGKPQVGIRFDKRGSVLFAQITKENLGKPLGIFLDGNMITSPIVQQEIKGGEAVISGDFSVEEAKKLINSLNAGAIPLPIELIEQRTTEPLLGKANIGQSIVAGLVGLVGVAGFMVLVYRLEGAVSLISLFIYAVYSIALYKIIGVVLTLSGVAGFILSIGMAVDANILIYERIKEERLTQKDAAHAVRVGFFRALSAIREANINTLLICFVLFNPFNLGFLPQFGMVKGFALTLAIGVLFSLFTGVFITKNLLWRLYKINK